ncbi:uncharacterized protein LOC142634847 [Castanea sativa]|uniref:uncharacterized protein LOC142634847 n=1 Tax=Castanea sativa TaxID=21020 RepID=UPI003F64A2A2
MQLEIDCLRKRLCRERRKRTPSHFNHYSEDDRDGNYKPKSRTLLSESFSKDEERHHRRKNKSSSRKGLGNDIMSRAFNQISKSPFTRRIEVGRLPRRFTQPTFTIYNGRIDPVEHARKLKQILYQSNEQGSQPGSRAHRNASSKSVLVTISVIFATPGRTSFFPSRVIVGDDEEKFFQVGVQLPPREREELIDFLRRNVDVFAWSLYEAPGVDPNFICHRLNVGAIKEVFYSEWLANTVVVKKKSGKWWVCVDFTDLNKACLKDPFPLPRIDQLVDATVGHPRMSFLDAGYYQIPLALEDQEKTSLFMPTSNYHYKGSILADLVAEFAEPSLVENEERSDMDEKSVGMVAVQELPSWKVYVDDIAYQRELGVGLVIVSLEWITIEKSIRLGFSATNNEAEYETLLVGMAMVQKMGGQVVEIFLYSRLVVSEVKGKLEARDVRMQDYLNQIRHLQAEFESFSLQQVPRSRNTHADSLSTLATSSVQGLPRVILVEDLYKPAEREGERVLLHQIRVGPSWMDLIVLFLKDDILPEEKGEADKVRRKAHRFWLFEDQKLYKCSFFRPYLLCIHPEVVDPLLEELHEGIYGSHTKGRSLSHKALT